MKAMSNLEKYNKIFREVMQVEEEQLPTLKFRDCENWDSVGFMTLLSSIEEAFSITLEPEDMMDFNSYAKGKEILSKTYGVQF